MGRKSKAFSQTMVLSCERPNGQSRHPLIADKTPASARSSTKFSKTLKNSGENKSGVTQTINRSLYGMADGIV